MILSRLIRSSTQLSASMLGGSSSVGLVGSTGSSTIRPPFW